MLPTLDTPETILLSILSPRFSLVGTVAPRTVLENRIFINALYGYLLFVNEGSWTINEPLCSPPVLRDAALSIDTLGGGSILYGVIRRGV